MHAGVGVRRAVKAPARPRKCGGCGAAHARRGGGQQPARGEGEDRGAAAAQAGGGRSHATIRAAAATARPNYNVGQKCERGLLCNLLEN
eukprot:COSAG01_NODE_13528_length_1572_cov_1.688391_5_plen_88_part_01